MASAGSALAAAPGADHTVMYVADTGDNTVIAYDTTDGDVVARIPVGNGPWGVAVTPNGATAYVTDEYGDTVSVIDTATDTVTATIPVGQRPEQIAISPDGSDVYVANYAGSSISVISVSTNTVTATFTSVPTPSGIALSPDGSTAYVGAYDSAAVSTVSTASGSVTGVVSVGTTPAGVAVTLSGDSLYVADQGSDTVSVIDTATDAVTGTIPVGNGPYGLAVSPDGSTVFAADINSDTVSVIDTGTNAVTADVPVGAIPYNIAASPDGSTVYAANFAGNTVSVIDTGTDTDVATLTGFDEPAGMAFAEIPAPAVTGVSPNQGPETSGRTVTITGSGFTGASTVDFGSIPATSFTVNSPTSITATVPSSTTPGAVNVTVTTPIATSPSAPADQYTYLPVPAVTSVSPGNGPSTGGNTVTITGSGFAGASAVDFGSVPAASFAVNSPTSITASVPAGTAGTTADVEVTTIGGTSSRSAGDAYTYSADASSLTAAPVVLSISPGQISVNLSLSATLTDTTTRQPVPGRSITFSIGTTTLCTSMTNSHGIATCSGVVSVLVALLALHYDAAFVGSPALQPATAVGQLVQL